jgi:uncharacterized protein YjiS (DUF1127 family)
MAMIENAQTAPFGAVTTYRATNVFYSLVETVRTWINERIEARRTADALSKLSPAMLDDIGLTQGDVMAYRRQAGML